MLLDTPNLKALVGVSVDINHPVAEGHVRCHYNFQLHLFEPVEDEPTRTRLTHLADLELRGNITDSLQKFAKATFINYGVILRNHLQVKFANN